MQPIIEELAGVVGIEIVDPESPRPEALVTLLYKLGDRRDFVCPLAEAPQIGQQVTITYSWVPR